MISPFGVEHGETVSKNEVLDDWIGRGHDEDEAKKIQPRYVRNEKGQFLGNRPASPFGVPRDITPAEFGKRQKDPERGNKSFGSPGLTAATAGGAAALLVGRPRAGAIGTNISGRMSRRADWSAGRAAMMPKGKLRSTREKYAAGLKRVGTGPAKNPDVQEWMGRGIAAGVVGGGAGGTVAARRKLTPKEKR